MVKNTLMVNTEKAKDGKKYFSVSGQLGQMEYWCMGPYETKKLAEKYITELLAKGSKEI